MSDSKYTIDLPWNFVDHIVKTELSTAYHGCVTEIKYLNSQDTLSDNEMQDLKTNLEYRDAIHTVLRYYATSEELKTLISDE